VDYDQPIFEQLGREITARFGAAPTPEQLRAFVAQHISTKNYAHGIVPASKPARLKEGDCTEHAGLLTALLRRLGQPARVALGLALRLDVKPVVAFGHAWTERWSGSGWTPLDAAIDPPLSGVRVVPLSSLQNESLGAGVGDQVLMAVARLRIEPASP
jgi:hypothetical protein